MQETQLRYAIKFVAAMHKAVKFHRDVLGLKVKFESPGWSEFVTGETNLALHPASDKNRPGKSQVGIHCRRCPGFLPTHERQGCSVHHASPETGFRGRVGAVCPFRGRTLQRGREAA
jgi:hypothetical protein